MWRSDSAGDQDAGFIRSKPKVNRADGGARDGVLWKKIRRENPITSETASEVKCLLCLFLFFFVRVPYRFAAAMDAMDNVTFIDWDELEAEAAAANASLTVPLYVRITTSGKSSQIIIFFLRKKIILSISSPRFFQDASYCNDFVCKNIESIQVGWIDSYWFPISKKSLAIFGKYE